MNSNKFIKIFNAISLIVFTYQIIDLTITYCKFSTLVDLSTGMEDKMAAVSLCSHSKSDLTNNAKNITMGQYLQSQITEGRKNKRDIIVKSITPYQSYCITYNSQLYKESAYYTHKIFGYSHLNL